MNRMINGCACDNLGTTHTRAHTHISHKLCVVRQVIAEVYSQFCVAQMAFLCVRRLANKYDQFQKGFKNHTYTPFGTHRHTGTHSHIQKQSHHIIVHNVSNQLAN